jgi:hypothetical protein
MRIAVGWCCVVALAHPLPAQPRPVPAFGRVTGEVIDSLFTKAPLPDAEVVIEGIFRPIRTDARGRFAVDSVPAGTYRVGFFHPTIDDLGLQAATVVVRVTADDVAAVGLTTPSPASVYTVWCGAAPAAGRGIVVGVALELSRGAPVVLSRVVAQWNEVVVRGARLSREFPTRLGQVTSSGGYLLCDVPTDAELTMIGVVDDGRRGVLNLLPSGATVSARVLRLADSVRAGARGGVIVQRSGAPLPSARIELSPDSFVMKSDVDGRFSLRSAAPAVGELRTTVVAYRPVHAVLDSVAQSVVVTMDALTAQELAAVNVEAGRGRSEAPAEFEERRKSGFGTFITREQIAQRNPVQLLQLFDGMNGLVVDQQTGRVRNMRGASMRPCEPLYFVDGARFGGGEGNANALSNGALTFFQPEDVAGIEVYRGVAELPQQYGGSAGGCGAILIWTRRGADRR